MRPASIVQGFGSRSFPINYNEELNGNDNQLRYKRTDCSVSGHIQRLCERLRKRCRIGQIVTIKSKTRSAKADSREARGKVI